MMKNTLLGIGALTLLMILPTVQIPAQQSQAPANTAASTGQAREIKVTAKKFEFIPKEIVVNKGEQVTLLVTAVDHDHGFKLTEYDIDQLIKKGTTASISINATKAGRFTFHCSHFCGLGHSKMHGELIVQEAPATTP